MESKHTKSIEVKLSSVNLPVETNSDACEFEIPKKSRNHQKQLFQTKYITNERKLLDRSIVQNKSKIYYVCNQCSKTFPKECNMLDHIRTHTKEKPFLCDYKNCKKKFSQICNLKKHQKIHYDIKNYICCWEDCNKRFSASYNLKVFYFF